MTPHISAEKGEIASTVIMPGDPLRAKFIAENYLDDVRLVNTVRNMLCYTGTYKGKRISVMGHGMGIPSVGIYSYELYKFYEVDNIIRIGSCGAYDEKLDIFDLVLSKCAYTESRYAYTMTSKEESLAYPSEHLNKIIKDTSMKIKISIKEQDTFTSDCFDYYIDLNSLLKRLPKTIAAAEMEAFALFYNASLLKKNAACILTVVDSHYHKKEISANEREQSLTKMMLLALESALYL